MKDEWKCVFCNTENIIQMYVSKCDTCNVEYLLNLIWCHIPPHYTEWQLETITYKFNNNADYSKLMLYPEINRTILWKIKNNFSLGRIEIIEIPTCFEIVKPSEATALANRIYHMKAFL